MRGAATWPKPLSTTNSRLACSGSLPLLRGRSESRALLALHVIPSRNT